MSHHIVLILRLLQPEWRKALSKVADLVVSFPVGHVTWPQAMFEPLTIAFVFPLFCLSYLTDLSSFDDPHIFWK